MAFADFDLVICDIDGCLTPEHPGPLDAAALGAVAEHNRRAARDRDRPLVTLCSGRPQPFVELLARVVGNHRVPCIAENGVWLYDPGSNGYELDPGIAAEHLAAIGELAAWLRSRYAGQGGAVQPGKTASVSLYHPDHEWLVPRLEEVRAHCAERGLPVRVSMSWFYLNCDLVHVSKATGIARLIARLGLDPRRLAGIGDTAGDLAIADSVGFFACPANAEERILARAHYRSPLAEAAGVVDILEHLRGRERTAAHG
jgi:hydroxymethylpyrimidine pyrophosphatase-like HAD family hydrolase